MASTSASVLLPADSTRSHHLSGGAIGGIVGGILCALLISLAIVTYYRYKNRSKATETGEKFVTDPSDQPPGARLQPRNEPLDSGRLGQEINAKVETAFIVPQIGVSEGDDGGRRLLSDSGPRN